MEIYVNYLAIEVTRRCNMKCNHCLRGDAQILTSQQQFCRASLSISTLLPSFSRAASRL